MEDIKAILDISLDILNTRLTFGSFSFTFFNWILATCILSILVWFIRKLFD